MPASLTPRCRVTSYHYQKLWILVQWQRSQIDETPTWHCRCNKISMLMEEARYVTVYCEEQKKAVSKKLDCLSDKVDLQQRCLLTSANNWNKVIIRLRWWTLTLMIMTIRHRNMECQMQQNSKYLLQQQTRPWLRSNPDIDTASTNTHSFELRLFAGATILRHANCDLSIFLYARILKRRHCLRFLRAWGVPGSMHAHWRSVARGLTALAPRVTCS